MFQNNRNFNWRNLLGIGIGVLAVIIVLDLLLGSSSGLGMNTYYGRGMGYGNTFGTGYGGFLPSLFLTVIKLLWFVFVISLIIGIAGAAKRYVFNQGAVDFNFMEKFIPVGNKCANCGTELQVEYKFCPGCKAPVNAVCGCGQALRPEWQHCPACGKDAGRKQG